MADTTSDKPAATPKAVGMKSAYEAALERLEGQGIERPREDSLSAEAREQIAEVRRKAEARLAELEILHKDRAGRPAAAGGESDDDYVRERRRVEEDRERKIRQIRGD